MLKPLFILTLCLGLLSLCTVQKRVYQKGFFVEHSFKNKHRSKEMAREKPINSSDFVSANKHKAKLSTQEAGTNEVQIASANKTNFHPKAKSTNSASCDSLYLKDGSVLAIKVKELGLKDIRYKLCDFEEGPDYLVEKFRVSRIRFSNGMIETIAQEGTQTSPAPKSKNPETTTEPRGMETNVFATLSLTFGILGIYPLIFFGGVLGLIFGNIAKKQIRQNPGRYSNEKTANAGFIISVLGMILWVGLIFLLIMI